MIIITLLLPESNRIANHRMSRQFSILLALAILVNSGLLFAQDNQVKKDNSKPTNVYSQVDNFFQFETTADYNTFGYNPRISYAPNSDNSLVLEVPFLYTTKTNSYGLADIRLKYFYVPYRDYTKFFGALGLSTDVFFPVGDYKDGLGSSSWRVSPGLMMGFMLNEKQTISAFPVVSYIYTSKPTSNEIPEELREVDHGLNLQIITSFIISDGIFIIFTPIYDIKDIGDEKEDSFLFEVETVFDIMQGRYQVGTFYRGNLSQNSHTISLYFTIFL